MSGTLPAVLASPRAVKAAIDLFAIWHLKSVGDSTPLDRIAAAFLRKHGELNSRERRWITTAVYGTARLLRRQQHLLMTLRREATPAEYIKLWREEHDETPASSISSAITGLPDRDSPALYLRTTLSFPEEMAAELEALLGDEAVSAGESFNLQAPTTIRINPLRGRIERALAELPDAVKTDYSPWGISLPRRINLREITGFADGLFEIQEEASQLIALLTDVRPGMTVVDVCAGAGGKTLAMAAMMKRSGSLMALDQSETRLSELRERARRAGAQGIEVCRVPTSEDGTWKPTGNVRHILRRLESRADCVLLDAPCSGSGAIRRSPDAKWRACDLAVVTGLQMRLMEQAAALVAPGGRLVYATCAFERSQNEEIVERFLGSPYGRKFSIEQGKEWLSSAIERTAHDTSSTRVWSAQDLTCLFSGPFLRSWPHRHGTDSFFAARLQKS